MSRRALLFGEALIDEFPDRRVVAGAPLHIAAHLASFGWEALVVARVGDDADGRAIRERLERHGVGTSLAGGGPGAAHRHRGHHPAPRRGALLRHPPARRLGRGRGAGGGPAPRRRLLRQPRPCATPGRGRPSSACWRRGPPAWWTPTSGRPTTTPNASASPSPTPTSSRPRRRSCPRWPACCRWPRPPGPVRLRPGVGVRHPRRRGGRTAPPGRPPVGGAGGGGGGGGHRRRRRRLPGRPHRRPDDGRRTGRPRSHRAQRTAAAIVGQRGGFPEREPGRPPPSS